jgi:hypothetical protein
MASKASLEFITSQRSSWTDRLYLNNTNQRFHSPAGASFEEPNQLLQAIDAIFQSIEKAASERRFQEWMDRLTHCCVSVGGLVEGT